MKRGEGRIIKSMMEIIVHDQTGCLENTQENKGDCLPFKQEVDERSHDFLGNRLMMENIIPFFASKDRR